MLFLLLYDNIGGKKKKQKNKYEKFMKKGIAKKKTNDTIDKYQKMSKT